MRDFIHVTDLAQGHVTALNYLEQQTNSEKNSSIGFMLISLGSGTGSSVLELVTAFTAVSGQGVSYQFTARRAGDIAIYYVSADKAKTLLDWQEKLSITAMCEDTWRWQSMNPSSYKA